MGNYDELKNSVSNVIKTNGNQEITGSVLQNVLLTIISTIGANSTFAGIATPETNPGLPDQNVFYIAANGGTYPNFGFTIGIADIAIFYTENNAWAYKTINIAQASRVNELETQIGFPIPFEFGGIDDTNGNIIYNTIRIHSLPIYFSKGNGTKILTFEAPETINNVSTVYAYNGALPIKRINNAITTRGIVNFEADGTFDNIRISFKHSDETGISEEEKNNTFAYSDYGLKPQVDKNTRDLENLKYPTLCEYGGIDRVNGDLVDYYPVGSTTPNKIRIRTVPIYFSDGIGQKRMTYKLPSTLIQTHNAAHFAYLGVTPIKKIPNLSFSNGEIYFDADGTFDNIRISFQNAIDAELEITEEEKNNTYVYSDLGLRGKVEENSKAINNYQGLKYCALGDSITYGYIPRNYPGYPGQLKSFAELTAEKLGMSFLNFGIRGSTVAQHPSRNPMSVRYVDIPDDIDVITVMGGTNDVRNGIELGQMSDRTNTTYYGALHVLFQGLYTKFIAGVDPEIGKKKKIIILTPIKLLDSDKSDLPNTIENNANVLFEWSAWINAVKEVAAFYSFPVLDFYNLSGINPHLDRTVVGTEPGYTGNYNPYITDGTHPTQEGAEIMADVLIGFMKGLK